MKNIGLSNLKKLIDHEWIVVIIIKSKHRLLFRLPFKTWRRYFLQNLKSAIVFTVDVEQKEEKIFIYLNDLI